MGSQELHPASDLVNMDLNELYERLGVKLQARHLKQVRSAGVLQDALEDCRGPSGVLIREYIDGDRVVLEIVARVSQSHAPLIGKHAGAMDP